MQGDIHAQLNGALDIHAQDVLQIEIAKQLFMSEPSLGSDSVTHLPSDSIFRKMSISSIQASPHLVLERPEHHGSHIFPVRQGSDGEFGQKGCVPLHRDLSTQAWGLVFF